MGCQYNVCLIYKRVINANIIACVIAVFLLYLYAVDNICVGSLLAVKCIYACYQMSVCLLSNELLLAIKCIFACYQMYFCLYLQAKNKAAMRSRVQPLNRI